MRYLFAVVVAILGLWSLTWSMAFLAHVVVLGVCLVPLWAADVTIRPLVPCRYCNKGESWDAAHEHLGKFCPGWGPFGIFACDRTGRKTRWEVKLLRGLGLVRTPERRARDG